jgi:hypothetical protein
VRDGRNVGKEEKKKKQREREEKEEEVTAMIKIRRETGWGERATKVGKGRRGEGRHEGCGWLLWIRRPRAKRLVVSLLLGWLWATTHVLLLQSTDFAGATTSLLFTVIR